MKSIAIDENLKEKIKDLRFNQHKTIRKIAKITGKSSRDIILVLKELEGEVKKQRCKKGITEQGVRSREEPLHVKEFDLYFQGKSPLEVLKVLRLSETETTKYYMEYLRLTRLPGLSLTYEKLGSVHAVSFFCEAKQYCSGRRANCRRSDSLTEDCRTQSTIIC